MKRSESLRRTLDEADEERSDVNLQPTRSNLTRWLPLVALVLWLPVHVLSAVTTFGLLFLAETARLPAWYPFSLNAHVSIGLTMAVWWTVVVAVTVGGRWLGRRHAEGHRYDVVATAAPPSLTVDGRPVAVPEGPLILRRTLKGTEVRIGTQRIVCTTTPEAWAVAQLLSNTFGNPLPPLPSGIKPAGTLTESSDFDGVTLDQRWTPGWVEGTKTPMDLLPIVVPLLLILGTPILVFPRIASVALVVQAWFWGGYVLAAAGILPKLVPLWGQSHWRIGPDELSVDIWQQPGRRRRLRIPIDRLDPPRLVGEDMRREVLALSVAGRQTLLVHGKRDDLVRIADWLEQALARRADRVREGRAAITVDAIRDTDLDPIRDLVAHAPAVHTRLRE